MNHQLVSNAMTKQEIISLMCQVYHPNWGVVIGVEDNDFGQGFTPEEMTSIRQRMQQVYETAIEPYHHRLDP